MYESGIGAVLPDGMRTPALQPAGDDHIALWWEFISQRPGPWQLADYRRAAYLPGRLAARRRAGAAVITRFPRSLATPPLASLAVLRRPGSCTVCCPRMRRARCCVTRCWRTRCTTQPTPACLPRCWTWPPGCRKSVTCSTGYRRRTHTATRARTTCCFPRASPAPSWSSTGVRNPAAYWLRSRPATRRPCGHRTDRRRRPRAHRRRHRAKLS